MRTKTFKPWRIVTIRNWDGVIRADPTHSSELRRASWLTFDAAFGAGWPTRTPGAARALVSCVARIDRRVTGDQQVCLRTRGEARNATASGLTTRRLAVTGDRSQGPAGDRLVTGGVGGSMWRESTIFFFLYDFSHKKSLFFSHKIR